jgi:hypothetical protein
MTGLERMRVGGKKMQLKSNEIGRRQAVVRVRQAHACLLLCVTLFFFSLFLFLFSSPLNLESVGL